MNTGILSLDNLIVMVASTEGGRLDYGKWVEAKPIFQAVLLLLPTAADFIVLNPIRNHKLVQI